MKLPYNCLRIYGDILFASRAGKIHSFNVVNGSYIASWRHPDVNKPSTPSHNGQVPVEIDATDQVPGSAPAIEHSPSGPPPKRRKVSVEPEDGESGGTPVPHDEDADAKSQQKSKAKKKKGPAIVPVAERPTVSLMTLTPGGRHLVAVSPHDKAIFVLEHDGSGVLKELSKRCLSNTKCLSHTLLLN